MMIDMVLDVKLDFQLGFGGPEKSFSLRFLLQDFIIRVLSNYSLFQKERE